MEEVSKHVTHRFTQVAVFTSLLAWTDDLVPPPCSIEVLEHECNDAKNLPALCFMVNKKLGTLKYRIQGNKIAGFFSRRERCSTFRKITKVGLGFANREMIMRAVSVHEVRHKVQHLWGNGVKLFSREDILNAFPSLGGPDVLTSNYVKENDAQYVTWSSLAEMVRLNRYLTEKETRKLLLSRPP